MKTFDLAFIGWVTAMSVPVRVVSSLEALSSEPNSLSKCCYGFEAAEGEVTCCSLLRHDLLIMTFLIESRAVIFREVE